MKVIIHSPEDSASRSRLEALTNDVLKDLHQESDPDTRKLLAQLGLLLRDNTPISYQLGISPGELADRIRGFLPCLMLREDELTVRLLPSERLRYPFLVTNSPDVPFLLDSLKIFLQSWGVGFRVVAHPIFCAIREKGRLRAIQQAEQGGSKESCMILRLEEVDGGRAASLRQGVESVLQAVLQIDRDRSDLAARMAGIRDRAVEENHREFWSWLLEGNFLPMAYRSLEVHESSSGQFEIKNGDVPGLGAAMLQAILEPSGSSRGQEKPHLEMRKRVLREKSLVIDTLETVSPVARSEPLVYLGWRDGKRQGSAIEHGFLGLFTDKSIEQPAQEVPLLKKKIDGAIETLGLLTDSHDYRKTLEFFHSFPKTELFFMAAEEILHSVRSFTLLYREDAVKVVATRSMAPKGIALMVFMPRAFHSEVRMRRVEAFLRRTVDSTPVTSQIIHISPEHISLKFHLIPDKEEVQLDLGQIERRLTQLLRPWDQKLRLLLERQLGEHDGYDLWRRYRQSFPSEYPTLIHPRFALRDIQNIERLFKEGGEILDLWGPFRAAESFYRLQVYSNRKSYLNDLMPLLENLNLCVLDEVDFVLRTDHGSVYIKSFSLRTDSRAIRPLFALRPQLLPALAALRQGLVENDYLHRLLVLTGLAWEEIDIFRGYRNYFFQLGSPFTKRRVAYALIDNPQVALLLYRYFEARFRADLPVSDPLDREVQALAPIRQDLITALEQVTDINEDRILRTMFNLIDSTVRTNYYLRQGKDDYFFSFKISALGIIDMPAPRPMYEIYVHSATMEGIHLRGGKVARGGIRWSDRPDDFRTEILGLMKTQMTKNALIVPVGSKGGFVVKTPYASREEGAALAKEAYRTLMRGLLDLTDNRVQGKVVRAGGIVAHDDDDPYLVVAADKGTAHLPDTANEVARDYRFWLDDAFASGGSQGYDHKKLGITARGAWECVKIHFLELGMDIQSEPFTVIGVGDMSGDVFGNGMLLSPHIRLLAAFDHRHVFLDPNPDAETSFLERQRLFQQPKSSWDDYDRSLISPGGGVFPRDVKDIPLSLEARQRLQVRHDSTDGDGLIRMILRTQADLLWNGGIGTYVKASNEKSEDVGDRANDTVRINATDLQVRVIGEGGNLGLTQLARVEFALAGGKINTDAIDNAGGVNCSDHEVNLKIGLGELIERGVIGSVEERNRLLEEVTEDVCQAVLEDNSGQALGISLDLIRCQSDPEPFIGLVDRLAAAGALDRAGEFLPTAKTVRGRAEGGYTRPELSILMAYQKMQLFQALLDEDVSLEDEARDALLSYFPGPIREKFGEDLVSHPLAREITATVLTNKIINRTGGASLNLLSQQTEVGLAKAAMTYLVFDRVLVGEKLLQGLDLLQRPKQVERIYVLRLRLEQALSELCRWALIHQARLNPDILSPEKLENQLRDFEINIGGFVAEGDWAARKDEAAELGEWGLAEDIARRWSVLDLFKDFLPLVALADRTRSDLYSVARVMSEVRKLLDLDILRGMASRVPIRDRWDRQAQEGVLEALDAVELDLSRLVIEDAAGNPDAFLGRHRSKLRFYHAQVESLKGTSPVNLHPFEVLVRILEGLTG